MDDTNKGALWKNDKKMQGDNKPHFTGNLDVHGVRYRVSCWATEANLLQENPKRPRMSMKVISEADWQQKYGDNSPQAQQAHSQGMQQVQQALQQPSQAQQYQQASGGFQGVQQAPPAGTQQWDDDIPF